MPDVNDADPAAPIANRRVPYVFVVGCPRSGTTLLQRMLDAHPQLTVSNDTHFIPRAIEALAPGALTEPARAAALPLTPEWVEWVRAYHRFARLGLKEESVDRAASGAATYVDFVGALYKERARMEGKPLAGEKTPDYAKYLPLLHGLFPWARSMHIIRDGRDVALSALEWAREDRGPGKLALWREQPVAVSALWWRHQVGTGRRDGAALGPARYLEVKYEQLVERPADVLAGIARFLDLPSAAEMLAFHAGKTREQPGLSAKKAWLPPTPGLRDWRSQMAPESVELFEALAGDLLAELGYPRQFTAISPTTRALAERCRAWWQEELLRKQRKLADRTSPEASASQAEA